MISDIRVEEHWFVLSVVKWQQLWAHSVPAGSHDGRCRESLLGESHLLTLWFPKASSHTQPPPAYGLGDVTRDWSSVSHGYR